jgi:hypothetical protein
VSGGSTDHQITADLPLLFPASAAHFAPAKAAAPKTSWPRIGRRSSARQTGTSATTHRGSLARIISSSPIFSRARCRHDPQKTSPPKQICALIPGPLGPAARTPAIGPLACDAHALCQHSQGQKHGRCYPYRRASCALGNCAP